MWTNNKERGLNMLRVTVEIVPHGIESEKEVIDSFKIINNLSCEGRPAYGNYDVVFNDVRIKNIVTDFPRSGGALLLTREVLNNLGDNIE